MKEGLRSAARIVTPEEIADHGNGGCARVDHRPGVLEGDATDRDDWHRPRQLRRSTDELETHSDITRIFGASAEHRSDRYIANPFAQSALDLGNGVCGKADDRSFTEQPPRGLGRKIVLTDVNALRGRDERDVSAVVDDDVRVIGMSEPYRRVREIEQRRRPELFGAELNQRGAAVKVRPRKIDRRPSGSRCQIDVHDGVEAARS